MGRLIHINGAPGVGKLTIARRMAQQLGARVLDNHAIYNVAFALTDFQSPAFYEAQRAMRATAHDLILRLPDSETLILTDAYNAHSDWAWENWRAIEQMAAARRWPFFTVALYCDADEHRRRIVAEDRAARGKLQDPAYVDRAAGRPLIEREGPLSMRLDVTCKSAEEAAATLVAWIESASSSL